MPLFVYTARDQTGNLTNGTLEAPTNSHAAAHLREQGLWVTDLRVQGARRPETPAARPAVPKDESFGKRLRSPVSQKDLSLFYRQLYTLINSGVALYQSLEMLSNSAQSPNPHLRRIVAEMGRHVLQGGRLSESMARYPWCFDRMQVRMVEAGEAGGLLAEIFKRLADYLEREYETRLEIKRKTLYPKLVFLLFLLVWPISAPLNVANYLNGLANLLLWVGGVCAVAWLCGRILLTSSAGRDLWDQVKLAIPVIGGLIRKMAVARFARSLAALYGAGVPIASALQMAGEASGNHALEMRTMQMVFAVEKGVGMAPTMEASGFFPPMFTGMVRTGETSGNLDTMLDKAADFYEEEAAHAVTQLVVILGVVLLIMVAILVIIKLVSFYMGYFSGIAGAAAAGAGGE